MGSSALTRDYCVLLQQEHVVRQVTIKQQEAQKCKSVPVEKASDNNIFHSEYNHFKTVTTNQQVSQ